MVALVALVALVAFVALVALITFGCVGHFVALVAFGFCGYVWMYLVARGCIGCIRLHCFNYVCVNICIYIYIYIYILESAGRASRGLHSS